jgi:hypothetical protein
LEIRAQQYRELLERERFFEGVYLNQNAQKGLQSASAAAAAASHSLSPISNRRDPPAGPALFQTQVPALLYDIGREGGTTPICNKCSRETFYCKHRIMGASGAGSAGAAGSSAPTTLRRVGPHQTAASAVGAEIVGAEKPLYGRKSQIKEFFDANHLSVMPQ